MSGGTHDEPRAAELRTAAVRAQQAAAAQRQRQRVRRDHLSGVVGVLDDVGEPGQPHPYCADEVARFYGVHPTVIAKLLRGYAEEFRSDGWLAHSPYRRDQDLWTDRAVVRAGLLLEQSATAAHLRHLLGVGDPPPLAYSQSEQRVSECRKLYEKALGVVADIHECSPDELWRSMQSVDRYELMAMVMTLAALTPYDRPALGKWLRELSTMTRKDGSVARGLALLIPQRQPLDGRQGKPAGAALDSGYRTQDAVAQ